MTDGIVSGLIQLVAVLIGAGAGSYFGLKGALNGLRDGQRRTEKMVADIWRHVTR